MNRCSTLIVLAAMAAFGGCTEMFKPEPIRIDSDKESLDARVELMRAANSQDPVVRCHAIEAMEQTMGTDAAAVYLQGLSDPNQGVRFVATNAVGDLKLTQAKDTLARAINNPATEKSVQAATIYALYSIGADAYTDASGQQSSYISWLGRLLFDDDKIVRANTALAMGNIGEPSALGPMKALLIDEREPMVQLQLIESMALLGDARSASLLEAYTKSNFMDERLTAIPAIARLRLPRGKDVLSELLSFNYPPQVRVAAFGAIARLGEVKEDGYKLAIESLNEPRNVLEKSYEGVRRPEEREVASLQALAAIALGWTARDEAIVALRPATHSADGAIRVEAAMSTLRLLSRYKHIAPPDGAFAPQPVVHPAPRTPVSGPSARPAPVTGAQLPSLPTATTPACEPTSGSTARRAMTLNDFWTYARNGSIESLVIHEQEIDGKLRQAASGTGELPDFRVYYNVANDQNFSKDLLEATKGKTNITYRGLQTPSPTSVPVTAPVQAPAPAPAPLPVPAPVPVPAPAAGSAEDQPSSSPPATTRPSGFKTSGIKD